MTSPYIYHVRKYASTCSDPDVAMMLRECADRMEADADMIEVLREQNRSLHAARVEAMNSLDAVYESLDRILKAPLR